MNKLEWINIIYYSQLNIIPTQNDDIRRDIRFTIKEGTYKPTW